MQSYIDAINRIPMIDTLLEVICRTTGMGFAVIARVTETQWIACAVYDKINFGLPQGGELKLETTLCNEVNQQKEPIVIDHVAEDNKYACHHTPIMYGFQSYISVPITLRSGDFFGTLCAIDPKPAQVNNPETIGMFKLYAELISFHLSTNAEVQTIESTLVKERLAANEQISLSEKLITANEALLRTNEELNNTQKLLQTTVSEVEASRERFRIMIEASPVAMLVTRGDNMVFEEINAAMLLMIGKDKSVKGKPWFEAIPELVGQPIINELYHTYHTGEEHRVSEVPILLMIDGEPYYGFYNITYTALSEEGKITGVMQSVVDVTPYITAKNELQSAYEQLRLSKEAAQLGTFDMDLTKGTMEWDERCRLLFGISHNGPVTYEKDFLMGLHPDDRERVPAIIENVFVKSISNGVYDVEYRTVGAEDQQLRWVRAKGQAYFDEKDKPVRFIGSVLDITEEKQDELRKNDFVSMASHELKTPLTSLNAYVQVLQSKAVSREDEFAIGAFAKIKSQINKMTNLINGFLNVSRLDAGKIHLNLQSFDLVKLMEESADETRITAPAYNLIMPPCAPVWVEADKDKIAQVLSNLLSNAVKYSPKGRTITLSCKHLENNIQVSVQDEGMGVKPESINKLFDRFYRVDTKHTQHIAGFGIGLYLCAEIIKRHEGKIWAESEIGKGSTFYFSLPLKGSNLNE